MWLMQGLNNHEHQEIPYYLCGIDFFGTSNRTIKKEPNSCQIRRKNGPKISGVLNFQVLVRYQMYRRFGQDELGMVAYGYRLEPILACETSNPQFFYSLQKCSNATKK